MKYEILDRINSPADLKGLDMAQLRQLCAEIRAYMVECCATNPGHLGASLGAVELIVGWHYVFDAPQDKIVFDVGPERLPQAGREPLRLFCGRARLELDFRSARFCRG